MGFSLGHKTVELVYSLTSNLFLFDNKEIKNKMLKSILKNNSSLNHSTIITNEIKKITDVEKAELYIYLNQILLL